MLSERHQALVAVATGNALSKHRFGKASDCDGWKADLHLLCRNGKGLDHESCRLWKPLASKPLARGPVFHNLFLKNRGGIMTTATYDASTHAAGARRTRFYLWMAVAMSATAFIGFAPTFWLPMAQGIPERIVVLAIHGALFFGWTLFVIYQAWLVGSDKVARHRDVGMIGVSLATAMTIFGVMAAIELSQTGRGLEL